MEYEAPAVEAVGCASELIQAYAGPYTDGGGWQLSQGAVVSALEND